MQKQLLVSGLKRTKYTEVQIIAAHQKGVVGWHQGVVYFTSPGHPTDIGLQLGKPCCPCSR